MNLNKIHSTRAGFGFLIMTLAIFGFTLTSSGCGGGLGQPFAKPLQSTPTRTPRPVGVDLTGNEVKTEFQGTTYYAQVIQGGIVLSAEGLPSFDGIVSGKLVVDNQLYEGWNSMKFATITNVRLLRYDATSNTFLVDGIAEYYESNLLFIAPGAVIENSMLNHEGISLAGLYDLAFGETVEFDVSGNFISRSRP